MQITLAGKVALVTGGGAGIGHAIVEAYAELGTRLAIAEVDAGKCEALRKEFPKALVVRCDVRKAGEVEALQREVAIELGHEKIRVNGIAPETTDSEQVPLAQIIKPGYEAKADRILALGRYGRPEDQAGAAVYLATDLSSWVTGTMMLVDGGSLVQGIFHRMPEGNWTVMPIVTDQANFQA